MNTLSSKTIETIIALEKSRREELESFFSDVFEGRNAVGPADFYSRYIASDFPAYDALRAYLRSLPIETLRCTVAFMMIDLLGTVDMTLQPGSERFAEYYMRCRSDYLNMSKEKLIELLVSYDNLEGYLEGSLKTINAPVDLVLLADRYKNGGKAYV